jgi:C1A family cysteine protease
VRSNEFIQNKSDPLIGDKKLKKNLVLTMLFIMAVSAYPQSISTDGQVNPDYAKWLKEKNLGQVESLSSDGHALGYVPTPFMIHTELPDYLKKRLQIQVSLPASFDLRLTGGVSSVKNQGQCGSCWTFGTMGSIESCWLIAGRGTYDLSEDNLNTCHLPFEWTPCNGGNAWISAAYLSRGSGPASESDDPYSDTHTAVDCPSGLVPQGIITSAWFIPSSDPSVIKNLLQQYGALYTAYYHTGSYYNSSNYTYYYSGSSSANHAVTLVGWDDNKVTAGGTGAWIIKNSWGASWGQNGYFYIAYQDSKINSELALFKDFQDYNAKETISTYTEAGNVTNAGYSGSSQADALVKFVANGDVQLTKIGTWAVFPGAVFNIDIYDNFNGTNSLTGLLGSISNQNATYTGYHTFDLASPINISNGNDYFVKINYQTTGYNWPIPIEEYWPGYCSPTIETGKNWIKMTSSSSWSSLDSYKWDICIYTYSQTQAGLEIRTTGLPTMCPGIPYSAMVIAQGGTMPYEWSVSSGTLPPGLELDAATGAISGNPTTEGTFQFTIHVQDSQNPKNQNEQVLSIATLCCDCEFSGPNLDCFEKYVPLAGPTVENTSLPGFCRFTLPNTAVYNLTKTLDAAPQLRVAAGSGDWSIETRVNVVSNSSSSFAAGLMVYFSKYDVYQWGFNAGYTYLKLARTPSGVLNSISYTGGRQVDLRIRKVGNVYYFDYKKTTVTTWTTATSKTLTTAPVKAGLLCLSTAKMALKADFDHCCLTGNQLEIMSPCPLLGGQECVDYNYTLTARGGTPPYQNWSVTGSLPPGLNLATATGIISGTPTEPGDYNFSLHVEDSGYFKNTTTISCSMTIGLPPTLTILTTTLPVMCQTAAYSAAVTAQGGCPPYKWTVSSGGLPAGLSLDPATGVISGAPQEDGNCQFTVKVSDSHDPANEDEQALEIVTNCCNCQFSSPLLDCFEKYIPTAGPSIDVSTNPGFCRFVIPKTRVFNQTGLLDDAPQLRTNVGSGDWQIETRVTVVSSTNANYALGLEVYFSQFDVFQWGYSAGYTYVKLYRSAKNILLTKAYSGGKTVDLRIRKQGNVYYFELKTPSATSWTTAGTQTEVKAPVKAGLLSRTIASNAVTADYDYSCKTNDELGISTTTLPEGYVNKTYSSQVVATGGTLPYTWSLVSGALPDGLEINSSGQLSGLPTTIQTANFTLRVTDAEGTEVDTVLLIDVQTLPVIDEEFHTGSLAGYTSYIPIAGPTITSGINDQLRITVPNTRAFDHWTSVDAAPQLRRPLDTADWAIETKVKIVSASSSAYHAGLLVYFSQYDLYYWGYNAGTGYIKLSLTGTNGIISKSYTGGTTVELRIEKSGNTYTFKYRKPGVLAWSLGGSQTRTAVPTHIGLIARTTAALNLTADFEYLRLTTPAGSQGELDDTGNEPQAELESIPTSLVVSENYPNPFNSSTHLDLALPEQSSIVCNIYNIQGQLVRDLYDATLPAGNHRIQWDGLNDNGMIVNSGTYFIVIRIKDRVMVRKILFLK